jgi:hypothetical protein
VLPCFEYEQSDTSIPVTVNETDWSEMHRVTISHCEHGRHTVMKKVWGQEHWQAFHGLPIAGFPEFSTFSMLFTLVLLTPY